MEISIKRKLENTFHLLGTLPIIGNVGTAFRRAFRGLSGVNPARIGRISAVYRQARAARLLRRNTALKGRPWPKKTQKNCRASMN
jgi:hypothetical protein